MIRAGVGRRGKRRWSSLNGILCEKSGSKKNPSACITGACESRRVFQPSENIVNPRQSVIPVSFLRRLRIASELPPYLAVSSLRHIHSARLTAKPVLSDSDFQELGLAPKRSEIFDTKLKRLHRDRAALLVDGPDPILQEVTDRLLDRLEDCRRSFPVALNLGGAGEHVRRQLQGRGGIERVIMVDSSAAMLQTCSGSGPGPGPGPGPAVEHLVVEEEMVPLEPSSVDVVISSMGLHWVNNLPGVMTQCRQALKPDGLFIAAMLGGDTLRELRIACTVAQQERQGGISPRVSPFAQVRDAGNLLTRAGLTLPAVDVDDITMRYPSAIELVEHLRSMGEGNAVLQRAQTLNRDTALATAAIYQAMFGEEDGTVPATFQVIYMAGWSPHSSQQLPRTRGSASVSLKNIQESLKEGRKPPAGSGGEEKKTDDGKGGVSGRTDLPSGSWYKLD